SHHSRRQTGSAGGQGRVVQDRQDLGSRMAGRGAGRGTDYRALADLNRVIEFHPADAYAISCRGQVYLGMGRYDEALADLHRRVELDPADADVIGARGQTYRARGRVEQGLTGLDRGHG